jgi:hypothetical protein
MLEIHHPWEAMSWAVQERQAIMRMLKMQGMVRANLAAFIEHRGALRTAGAEEDEDEGVEKTPPPPNGDRARLTSAISGIARTFADPHKTQDLLGKLGYRRHTLAEF